MGATRSEGDWGVRGTRGGCLAHPGIGAGLGQQAAHGRLHQCHVGRVALPQPQGRTRLRSLTPCCYVKRGVDDGGVGWAYHGELRCMPPQRSEDGGTQHHDTVHRLPHLFHLRAKLTRHRRHRTPRGTHVSCTGIGRQGRHAHTGLRLCTSTAGIRHLPQHAPA